MTGLLLLCELFCCKHRLEQAQTAQRMVADDKEDLERQLHDIGHAKVSCSSFSVSYTFLNSHSCSEFEFLSIGGNVISFTAWSYYLNNTLAYSFFLPHSIMQSRPFLQVNLG